MEKILAYRAASGDGAEEFRQLTPTESIYMEYVRNFYVLSARYRTNMRSI